MRVDIVSPSASSNALGRALALADLIRLDAEVRVLHPPTRTLWPGVEMFPEVPLQLATHRTLSTSTPDVLWAVKPFPLSFGVALRHGQAPVVLDIDDDDARLAREFAARSLGNSLRLRVRRTSEPAILRVVARVNHAVAETVATFAVAEQVLGAATPQRPRLRIPHPRRRTGSSHEKRVTGVFRLGLFGTLRSHKGLKTVVRLSRRPGIEVHLLERGVPASAREPLRREPGIVLRDDGVAEALQDIHCVVLLQDPHSQAAQVQLPVKYFDALLAARPVLATPTRALKEAAAPGTFWIEDWSDQEAVDHALERVRDEVATLGEANLCFGERFAGYESL